MDNTVTSVITSSSALCLYRIFSPLIPGVSAYGEVSKGIFVTNRPNWEMMKWLISSNEEAYKFTDVSYFSRFNSDIYDTFENVQPILVCGMLHEDAGPS